MRHDVDISFNANMITDMKTPLKNITYQKIIFRIINSEHRHRVVMAILENFASLSRDVYGKHVVITLIHTDPNIVRKYITTNRDLVLPFSLDREAYRVIIACIQNDTLSFSIISLFCHNIHSLIENKYGGMVFKKLLYNYQTFMICAAAEVYKLKPCSMEMRSQLEDIRRIILSLI